MVSNSIVLIGITTLFFFFALFNTVISFSDSSPVESHVLGTDEVSSSSFNKENYLQVGMSLLLVLQTAIR